MIKIVWDFSCYCDYKCEYCFYTGSGWDNIKALHGKDRLALELDELWKAVYEKYGSCKIYFTGGEPFLYPDFVNIIAKISNYHKIHITSNLSQNLDIFIKTISPDKVSLNSTYHPLFTNIEDFSKQVLKLKNEGFVCGVCYLAHPVQLREMLNYKKYLKKLDIDMAVTLFDGNYKGKKYPKDYSKDEIRYLNYVTSWVPGTGIYISGTAEEKIRDNLNAATSNSHNLCNAGYKYASIKFNGDVTPCGRLGEQILGNIYKKDISLFLTPKECPSNFDTCKEFEHTK
ncbi:MAG: radical SAM protein [Elusimicrobia bacterium]|nr:radical SAM protein [Candidatus Liberimonas magnetica]